MNYPGAPIPFRVNRVITEIEAPPRVAPPPAPPQLIPPPPRSKLWPVVAGLAAVLILASFAAWLWRAQSAGVPVAGGTRTAIVERQDFVNTLRLSGTVEAVESIAITAPMLQGEHVDQLTITKLAPGGTRVHKGDVLVEFDRQPQITTFLDKQAEYQDLLAQIARKQADEAAARAKDSSDLEQAANALKRAQLEVQKNEILSPIDAEKNQEALTEAQANLKELRTTFDLKRKAAQADIQGLEIQRDRARAIMQHAQENEERMTVRSPIDGVVVLNNIWKGGSMGEVMEGDQVYPWAAFMRVVDPSAMQVRVKVNQEDVNAINSSQESTVRLDAYPDLSFPAHLQELAPMGETSELSNKVRTFTAIYRIEGSDSRLVPDLSAAVDVHLERQADALVVPRDCVVEDGAHRFVWVKSGSAFDKREIEVGAESDLNAVVRSGLKAGDVVLRGKA
jgi:HlyD family secretion protein